MGCIMADTIGPNADASVWQSISRTSRTTASSNSPSSGLTAKAVTALSPLQFQKQIRLQEAQRLILGDQLDAVSAAFRVGYNDASHFNREYKRLFGLPLLRDVERLREANGLTIG